MAVFNYELNRHWFGHESSQALAGVGNNKDRLPFISSNGYYGYLPVYADDSNAMDTNDVSEYTETPHVGTYPISQAEGKNGQRMNNHDFEQYAILKPALPPRKRNSSEELDENFKRIRKEEPPIEGATSYQVPIVLTTHSSDYHYPRCSMGHYV